jgi:hypothetical protein
LEELQSRPCLEELNESPKHQKSKGQHDALVEGWYSHDLGHRADLCFSDALGIRLVLLGMGAIVILPKNVSTTQKDRRSSRTRRKEK